MSQFDPTMFLQTSIKAELDTQIIPCPQGDYRFTISKFDARQASRKDDPNTKLTFVDFTCDLDIGLYPEVVEATKRANISIRYSIIVDLDEQGRLDVSPGANVSLGRLREALDQNDGSEWSFSQVIGRPFMGKVSHEPYKGAMLANITAVAKIDR
jgi:hypothetical protein